MFNTQEFRWRWVYVSNLSGVLAYFWNLVLCYKTLPTKAIPRKTPHSRNPLLLQSQLPRPEKELLQQTPFLTFTVGCLFCEEAQPDAAGW